MNKILIFILFSFSSLFAREYMTQINPYERIEIKSQSSGVVTYVNKKAESKYIKDKNLLIKIDSKDEQIELQREKEFLKVQKEIVKIREKNHHSKQRVVRMSKYEQDNEKLLFLASKKELARTIQNIKKLQNEINKKTIEVQNKYISEIFIKEGEYVITGAKLFNMYDISKVKIELFLTQKEIENLDKTTLYVNGEKSHFKVNKINKIKDEVKVSRYKVRFVKQNEVLDNYFFNKIVKVELK